MENFIRIICDFIQIFMESFFGFYFLYIKSLSDMDTRKRRKIILAFTVPLSLIDIIFYCFFLNFMFSRITFAFLLFFSLLVKERKALEWKFKAVYSVVINCIFELNSFIATLCSSMITWSIFKIFNILDNDFSMKIVGNLWVLVLFFICNYIIFKTRIVNVEAIRTVSNRNIFFISCSSYMILVLFVKIFIKYFASKDWGISFTFLFWFISIIFMYIMVFIDKKYYERLIKINEIQNSNIKKSLEKPYIETLLGCSKEIYEKERKYYTEYLARLGLNINKKGFNQLVLAIIIVRHYPWDKTIIWRADVYEKIAIIVRNTSEKTVRNNIVNFLNASHMTLKSYFSEEEYSQILYNKDGEIDHKFFVLFMARKEFECSDKI